LSATVVFVGWSIVAFRPTAAVPSLVTKIVGTRDGLASPHEVAANRHLLPAGTRWVRVEGGNQSPFGWHGFQPGDRRATVDAAVQRDLMVAAVFRAPAGATCSAACPSC
jgi:hypothetical protein